MNPGYAGRTELPDNLKALFRPVTMVVPDLLQICMIMLFSEGFEDAFILGKKMTTLYKLAKEQLSKQYHYDWGLRALKSVLVLAGSLKREFSDMTEELVLFRALRDMNAPKFIFEDAPLFAGLLADLFPGLHCPRLSFEKLKIAIELDFEQTNKKSSEADVFYKQVDKTIQIYETFQARHTIMVVGPTGGGKSVCIEALQRSCLPAFNDVVKTWYMNAKAQSLVDLYGEMDPVTRDWTDGILSNVFRNMNRPLITGKENEKRWLIFDGDVDALWIENMNSVMDDNRLLTLINGDRIRLERFCKLLFEVYDLKFASPATISRCGMVYVDPKDLGYAPFYEKWMVKWRKNFEKYEGLIESLTEYF
jgi:dynein heavy chain